MNPGLKAIFASGHIDQNARAAMVKTGVNQFIQKPYVPREILKKVREVAESKAA
jgi:FixJ family two-component response regulator